MLLFLLQKNNNSEGSFELSMIPESVWSKSIRVPSVVKQTGSLSADISHLVAGTGIINEGFDEGRETKHKHSYMTAKDSFA